MELLEKTKEILKQNAPKASPSGGGLEGASVSGSVAVLDALLNESVTTIFGYPGGAIMPIYDALYDYNDRLQHILVRHEQGAKPVTKFVAPGPLVANTTPVLPLALA